MNLEAVWQKTAYLIVHMSNFELPLVLWTASAAAWALSGRLRARSGREAEALFALRVAAGCASFWLVLFVGRLLLK